MSVDVLGQLVLVAAEGGDAPTQLAEWSAAWGAFYQDIVAPLLELLLPVIVTWLLLVLAARLLALTPLFYGLSVRRSSSLWTRIAGFVLTVAAAAAFVSVAVGGEAGVSSLEGVLPALFAVFGVSFYAFGMATRPRLAATVTDSSGDANAALTTEVLARMRELNADDTRGRVEQPSTSDLTEIMAVAGTSDNWVVNLASGAMTMLFNLTPWRLDITIVDKRNALAVLHRNGERIDEAALRLPRDPVDADHPAELISLAAAFGAVTVARHYPDIVGFYGARDWRGIGMLAAARGMRGEDRRAYLDAALEADPQSILVEHAEIFRRYDSDADRSRLESLMDSLEPMIRQAAELADIHRPEFDEIKPKFWHKPREGDREPTLLMLRLLTLYTTMARNWSVLVGDSGWGSAAAYDRRRRAEQIIQAMVDLLPATPRRDRLAAREDLRRMEQRASLCYALFRRSGSAPRWVNDVMDRVSESTDFEVRYSYACYLARCRYDGDSSAATEPKEIADRLELVCGVVDYYRDSAMNDPELLLLSTSVEMRHAVLARMVDAWEIRRFGLHRSALAAVGFSDPELLAAPNITPEALKSEKVDLATAQLLRDGARILAAAPRLTPAWIDDSARLRATRRLLDTEGHTVATLIAAHRTSKARLVDGLGKAMFWAPNPDERRVVEQFLDCLVASLRDTTPRAERPAEALAGHSEGVAHPSEPGP